MCSRYPLSMHVFTLPSKRAHVHEYLVCAYLLCTRPKFAICVSGLYHGYITSVSRLYHGCIMTVATCMYDGCLFMCITSGYTCVSWMFVYVYHKWLHMCIMDVCLCVSQVATCMYHRCLHMYHKGYTFVSGMITLLKHKA